MSKGLQEVPGKVAWNTFGVSVTEEGRSFVFPALIVGSGLASCLSLLRVSSGEEREVAMLESVAFLCCLYCLRKTVPKHGCEVPASFQPLI